MRDDREVMLVRCSLVCTAFVALTGCGLLFPFDDGDGAPSSTTTSASAGGAGADGPGGAGSGGAKACTLALGEGGCGDVTTDPDNCGACGRACLGGECQQGACQLAPFLKTSSADQSFTNLVLRDGKLHVGISNGSLLHAALSDLGPSPEENLAELDAVPLGLVVDRVTVDAEYVYAASSDSGGVARYDFSGNSLPLGDIVGVVAMDASTDDLIVLSDADLARFPKKGGSPTSLTASVSHTSLLVAGKTLYWSSSADSAIYEIPVKGKVGDYSTFAADQFNPQALAIDEEGSIYWIAESEGFNVRRKRPGIQMVVDVSAPLPETSTTIALNCRHAYFDAGSTVRRVERDGDMQASEFVYDVPSVDAVLQLVIDEGILYVVTSHWIYRGVLSP